MNSYVCYFDFDAVSIVNTIRSDEWSLELHILFCLRKFYSRTLSQLKLYSFVNYSVPHERLTLLHFYFLPVFSSCDKLLLLLNSYFLFVRLMGTILGSIRNMWPVPYVRYCCFFNTDVTTLVMCTFNLLFQSSLEAAMNENCYLHIWYIFSYLLSLTDHINFVNGSKYW